MKFDGSVTVVNGSTGVDPIATPQNVPETSVVAVGKAGQAGPDGVRRILLALAGDSTETVTVTLYWRDPDSFQPPAAPVAANVRYYQIVAGTVVTNGQFAEVTAAIPNGGAVYIRVTAETVAANRVLHVVGLS